MKNTNTTTTTTTMNTTNLVNELDTTARILYKGFNWKTACKKFEWLNANRFGYMYNLRLHAEIDKLNQQIESINEKMDEINLQIADCDGSTKLDKLEDAKTALQVKLNEATLRKSKVQAGIDNLLSEQFTADSYITIRAYVAGYTPIPTLHNSVEIFALIEKLRLYIRKHNATISDLASGKKTAETKVDYITIKADLQAIVNAMMLNSDLKLDKIHPNFVNVICGMCKAYTKFTKASVLSADSGIKVASKEEIFTEICKLIVLQAEGTCNIE